MHHLFLEGSPEGRGFRPIFPQHRRPRTRVMMWMFRAMMATMARRKWSLLVFSGFEMEGTGANRGTCNKHPFFCS